MKIRLILVCTLLLLVAVPSFARPICKECDELNRCVAIPGAIDACYSSGGLCWTEPDPCSPPNAASVLAEWTVTSIEISRPADDAPAAKSEAETNVRTAETAGQK